MNLDFIFRYNPPHSGVWMWLTPKKELKIEGHKRVRREA
jgi:hypothetical protein